MKKEIKELIRAMEIIRGEDAEISIFHKLYGDQKLRCIFSPMVDEKIGFNIKGQEIYIERDKIERFSLRDGICFTDNVMTIEIKTE